MSVKYTINPDKCAKLNSSPATTNYGTENPTQVGSWNTSTTRQYHLWMEQDLSSLAIPESHGIVSAAVSLNVTTSLLTAENFEVNRCTRAGVVESQCTWNLYATGLGWTTPGGDMDPSIQDLFTSPVATGNFVIDVTNTVRDAVLNRNGLWSTIWRSVADDEDIDWAFNSDDDGSNPPILTIYSSKFRTKNESPQASAFRGRHGMRSKGPGALIYSP